MSTTDTLPLVCFAQDVCHALGISRTTLQRLRRHGAFPIPELVPPLDKRPRWARSAVEAYVEQRQLTHTRSVGRPFGLVNGKSSTRKQVAR